MNLDDLTAFPKTMAQLGKIDLNKVHTLANPKKFTYENSKLKGQKLKSSQPPMNPEDLQEKMTKQKELIDNQSKHYELPLNFPLCYVSKPRECPEPAAWAIQLNMDDPFSPMGFVCSSHFTTLPAKPMGGFYRVFACTNRNYLMLVDKQSKCKKGMNINVNS